MHIENLEHRYILARYMYAIGEPIISDIDYDELHKYMLKIGKLSEYTDRTWNKDPIPLDLFLQYDLFEYAVQSTKATERVTTSSMESITTWGDIRSRFKNLTVRHHLGLKYDGWNTQLPYSDGRLQGAESRGRDGDPLKNDKLSSDIPQTIPLKGEVVVVGEWTLSLENLKTLQVRIGQSRKSQRASVRTALSTGNADLLTFTAFSIWVSKNLLLVDETMTLLTDWGFNVTTFQEVVSSLDELEEAIKDMSKHKDMLVDPTDGLVLRNTLTNEMVALRVEAWAQGLYKSYVVDYVDSYASLYISQVVEIFPIDLSDSTQTKVAVTNMAYVVRLGLKPGAPIAFTLTSKATAVLDEANTVLLHKEWEGHWEEYKDAVRSNLI